MTGLKFSDSMYCHLCCFGLYVCELSNLDTMEGPAPIPDQSGLVLSYGSGCAVRYSSHPNCRDYNQTDCPTTEQGHAASYEPSSITSLCLKTQRVSRATDSCAQPWLNSSPQSVASQIGIGGGRSIELTLEQIFVLNLRPVSKLRSAS